MNIVVLDGYTLNPGDLSWSELESLGACRIFARTAAEQIIERARDAQILLTNKTELTRNHISELKSLKYIGITATGTNIVDLEGAREHNVTVTNVPAYGTHSVAQTTFALLLELTHRAGHHAREVRAGRWSSSLDWSFWDGSLIELAGLTMGIIGLGQIGAAVANLAVAFGMNTVAFTRSTRALPDRVKRMDLEQLLRISDVVSLHCPLTADTRQLINRERLKLMKPTAFLLNTSRGGLVEEEALAEALNTGRIAGAGLDVLSKEPPPIENPLLQAKNCIITPHFAWATKAARARLLNVAVANLRSFLAGQPQNTVA
jgi:glycerate dehydrogenase